MHQRLTHLTSTGEAHIVDVGSKQATKRTAIAIAVVHFSNAQPAALIASNANKKGDVLGVARIAGIMAAKRTPDLIPLCHPLAITNAEVDVRLITPGAGVRFSDRHPTHTQDFGSVFIQARVECVGPTGVEMEAMTAASAAALTVYDMSKAVDREAEIASVRVVYKSGGKSGTLCWDPWKQFVGEQFFDDRGLDSVR